MTLLALLAFERDLFKKVQLLRAFVSLILTGVLYYWLFSRQHVNFLTFIFLTGWTHISTFFRLLICILIHFLQPIFVPTTFFLVYINRQLNWPNIFSLYITMILSHMTIPLIFWRHHMLFLLIFRIHLNLYYQ